jgi:hypothetical protein
MGLRLWFAPIGKGERFDIDFKAHFLFAVFSRGLVWSEMALDEQHCAFGDGPLNGFRLIAPGITVQPDGDILHAALRADGKREINMWPIRPAEEIYNARLDFIHF